MQAHPFDRILAPRAVVVLGATGADSAAARVVRNLVAGGFPGALHVVGAAGAEVAPEVRARASLDEVEGALDLAVVGAPAGGVAAAVRACLARRPGGVVILPPAGGAGGEGALDRDAARALAAEAAAAGVRLLGPNSVGLLRPGARLNASFTNGSALPGTLGLVSQSGSICATTLDWAAAHRIGFSTVVSLGDASDVDLGDVLEYLAQDAATKSVLLYVETVRSARAFLSGLRLAARQKPVVVVKAGRTLAADGAPHPSDDAFDAALARTGAVRVASIQRMFNAATLLGTARAVSGNRLAILGNARGPALLAADRAAGQGVAVPPLAAATREKLDALLPPGGSRVNPVDLLGDAGPARYGAAVELCLADPDVDAVLAMLAPQALARPLESAEAVIAASRGKPKPLVACWMGEELVRGARARLVEAGIPELPAPETAVDAFGLLASYARNQRLLRQVPAPLAPEAMPLLERARELVAGALSRGRDQLTTAELQRLLGAIGIRDRNAAGQRIRGTELYVGVARDPVFGPVIRFGRGSAAGLTGEPVVVLPPLDTAIVRTVIRESRLAPVFTAAGGMGAPEVAAFERTLWALSETLSELPELRELEIAPLVVAGTEVYASGARVALAPPPPGSGRYDHMPIHPYPRHVGGRYALADGTVLTIRPIRPEDAEMEASFVRNLSDTSRHLRFMTALKELTREMLLRFTQLDYDRELALVAVVERGGKASQIGVARYAMADAETAHVAVVVADEWQGKGIGRRLMEVLVDAARARGFRRLGGEILADNTAIKALLGGIGFTFRRDPDGGDVLLIDRRLG